MLSEFKFKMSGEKILPLPLCNAIGMVLPLNSISPVVPEGIT
jgi:hypothetical protein